MSHDAARVSFTKNRHHHRRRLQLAGPAIDVIVLDPGKALQCRAERGLPLAASSPAFRLGICPSPLPPASPALASPRPCPKLREDLTQAHRANRTLSWNCSMEDRYTATPRIVCHPAPCWYRVRDPESSATTSTNFEPNPTITASGCCPSIRQDPCPCAAEPVVWGLARDPPDDLTRDPPGGQAQGRRRLTHSP